MVKANEIMLQHRIYDKPNLRMTVEAMLYRRAHQHNSGAAGGDAQAIGKSVGGNTTKIHMAVDAFGLPIEFQLTGGEVHDAKAAPDLIAIPPNDWDQDR